MCGIAGFYSTNQTFTEDNLHQMTEILAHRGPDATGYFFDNTCGLGHKRLSIMDLSAQANQPMYSRENSRFAIVYNGEIYNFQEIVPSLENVQLNTHSDTEVILEAFVQKHHKFVYQLNGMFSIAIYDRTEEVLYLFRDRIGIKPLYYYWDEEKFAFASELKSLVQLPQLSPKIDAGAVADFLHLGYIPAPKSIYQNIYKFPSGSWARISKDGVHIQKYWNLHEKIYDEATQQKLAILNKETEAKGQLKKLLRSSVNYRLMSDVPLGVFLSGGIDSSTVAALATEASAKTINTFSIGFKENKFNEATHAKAVAKQLGTHHHEFMLSVKEAQELIPQLLDFYDEPFADSSAIPTYLVSKIARRQVTVALGGDGGDELFLGYGMYEWARRLSSSFWKGMRKPVSQSLKVLKASKYQKASSLFDYGNQQELASHIFSQEQHLFSKKELNNLLIDQNFAGNYQSNTSKRVLDPMEAQALFDLEYYLQDDLLVKVDRASMQHGLEARVPLLDHRIIEFAINLSPQLRYKDGESKYLLKQILFDYLPQKMFERPKRGFSIPLIEWLRDDLSYLIEEYLNQRVIDHFGFVKYEPVEIMVKKYLKGNSYFYNRLWALIVLHQFLLRHEKGN